MNTDSFISIKRIIEKLSSNKQSEISILNYNGENWREVVTSIQQSEKIIASRFHSMILGMVFGVSILPIAYNKKFEQFLANFDLSHHCISVSDIDHQEPGDLNYLLFDGSTNIAEQANEHFMKLDELLMRGAL